MTTYSKIKYIAAALMLIGAPSAALAQTSTSLSGLFACEAVTNKDAQLSCFLSETSKLRQAATPTVSNSGSIANPPVFITPQAPAPVSAAPSIAPAPQVSTPTPAPTPPPAAKSEGKSAKTRTLAINDTSKNQVTGYVRFTLENGEVWQQIQPGRLRLGKESPDLLTIKKGTFNSFRARVNDKAPSIRVRRVK